MSDYMTDISIDGAVKGNPYQGVHEVSTVQRYPIGTKLELHGRTFRYSRAGEAIALPHRGSPNLALYPWDDAQGFSCQGLDVNAAKAGEKKLIVEVDDMIVESEPKGGLYKNWFTGGFAVIYNIAGDNGIIGTFRISGSEKSTENEDDATHEDIIIYLHDPLPYDLTPAADPATSVDLHPSPYLNVGAGASLGTHGRVVCVPLVAVASGSFFWGQTKGPAWVTPDVGITTANVHEVVFHSDGTVKVNTGDGLQRAGYMLAKGDGAEDDSLIMLMLE